MKAEQSRTFLRGFQGPFLKYIYCRLEIKFPDQIRDDPYDLEDIYKAAEFVLTGSVMSAQIHKLSSTTSSHVPPSNTPVKEEDFKMYMDSFAKSIIKAIGNQHSWEHI